MDVDEVEGDEGEELLDGAGDVDGQAGLAAAGGGGDGDDLAGGEEGGLPAGRAEQRVGPIAGAAEGLARGPDEAGRLRRGGDDDAVAAAGKLGRDACDVAVELRAHLPRVGGHVGDREAGLHPPPSI